MTPLDPRLRALIDELANALQTAALLSTRLRRDLSTSSQHAVDLEAAIGRAVRALRRAAPRRKGVQS